MDITFPKLANFTRELEYAKVSIPFPAGKIFDEKKILIVDENDNIIEMQKEVLARHRDNSIKWVLIHFLATLNANTKTNLKIKIDEDNSEYEKIDIDNKLKSIKPVILYINVDKIDYKIDLVFSELPEYKILRQGNVFSEIIIEKNFNISSTKTFKIAFIVSLFKDKDYYKIDVRLLNENEDDLVVSDFYILYKEKEDVNENYIAHSNYKTIYLEGDKENKNSVYDKIDSARLMNLANEHFPETFHGAYYGVLRNNEGGIAITIKEAFQNYPKALLVDSSSISAYLIPSGDEIVLRSGVQKTHTLYIQQFNKELTRDEINGRHHQFQMADIAFLNKEIYMEADIKECLFEYRSNSDLETFLTNLCDFKGFSYGMLNFGDVYDKGYTNQGRGGKHLVFTNNEYDFPYYSYLFYLRNGSRRFYDYFTVAIRHMIDIDICHYSKDPFKQDGLIEHSKDHITGKVALSHEWLRGLICYYHETGDIFARDAFLKMGENILRNLERPIYSEGFEVNVRETGWALFALVALYEETYDEKYLKASESIVNHFIEWKEKYGALIAPYTNHTLIRVPFMIAVACNSLYEYYLITKDERIKELIITSVDDLIENCLLENGYFYYKELPSLQRTGNNPIVLETLATAYSFTNDRKYLEAGMNTFKTYINKELSSGTKVFLDNTVLIEGLGTKGFSQGFYPLIKFSAYASKTGLI